MKPTVIIEIDKDGNYSTAFTGDVDVFWVDENAVHDRVFKSSNQVTEGEITDRLGGSEIGFTGDNSEAQQDFLNGLRLALSKLN